MNFYKHHIGDYAKKTAHLSIVEHGAYLLMLHFYYGTEAPLPKGRALYRLLRADSKIDRDAIDSVCRQFWTETPTGFANGRADEEIAAAVHQREVNRELGKRGGRPKRTEPITESVSQPEPNTKANHNPIQTPDVREDSVEKDSTDASASQKAIPAEAPDPRKQLWDLGVSLLGESARSLIGKGIARVGESKVGSVLGDMAARPTADPKAYFVAATTPRQDDPARFRTA